LPAILPEAPNPGKADSGFHPHHGGEAGHGNLDPIRVGVDRKELGHDWE